MIGEGQDGRVEGCVFIFSCENSKIQLAVEQPSTECCIPPKRDTPHPRAQQEGRRGEIAFRLKPHTHQRCSEGSDKTPGSRDRLPARDWARPVFESTTVGKNPLEEME